MGLAKKIRHLRISNIRIHTKFIVTMATFLSLAIFANTFFFTNRSENILIGAMQEKTYLLNKNLSTVAQNALIDNRFSDLQRLIHEVSQNDQEINLLLVSNSNSVIMASSNELNFPVFSSIQDAEILTLISKQQNEILWLPDGLRSVYYIIDSTETQSQPMGLIYMALSDHKLQQTILQLHNSALAIALIILFFAILSSYWIARRITNPIGQLAEDVKRISSGELDVAIKPIGHDEIGSLMKDVERMRSSIREAFTFIGTQNEQITQYSEELEKMVADRTKELQEALHTLRQKDEIIDMELDLAGQIQQGVMPQNESSWDGIHYAARVKPMEKVSGDFFEVIKRSESCSIILADVSGHGVPAALVTMAFKQVIRAIELQKYPPKDFFSVINSEMLRSITTTDYLTAFNVHFVNSEEFYYSSAGHPPAYLLRCESKEIIELSTDGVFLGAFAEAHQYFEEKKEKLNPGDKIVLYTDGVLELENESGERLGDERFKEILRRSMDKSASEIVDTIFFVMEHFQGEAKVNDDISVIVIELSLHYLQVQKHIEKGLAYLKEGKYHEARKEGDKIDAIISYIPQGFYINALSLYHLGEYKQAIPYFAKYLARFFDQMPTIGLLYYESLLKVNMTEEAMEFGQRIFYEDMPIEFYRSLLAIARETNNKELITMILNREKNQNDFNSLKKA